MIAYFIAKALVRPEAARATSGSEKKRRGFARPTAPLRATFPASRFRVRHRRRAAPDKILPFVHGATYPAETALSIASNG